MKGRDGFQAKKSCDCQSLGKSGWLQGLLKRATPVQHLSVLPAIAVVWARGAQVLSEQPKFSYLILSVS